MTTNALSIDPAGPEALKALRADIKAKKAAPALESVAGGNEVAFYENGNIATLILTNRTNAPQTTGYIITVLDGDDNTWKLHTQGEATVNPNSVFEQGFHKWRALRWRCQAW